MSNTARDQSEPTSVAEKAAVWLLRYNAKDLSTAERFAYLQWLKESPIHIEETLRMARLYSWLQGEKRPRGWFRWVFDKVTGQRSPAEALFDHSDLFSGNVVELKSPSQIRLPQDSPLHRELLRETIITPLSNPSRELRIEVVDPLWLTIIPRLQSDPQFMYQIPWRQWEEIVAAAYKREGFNVELTPRSNDGGRDVIATRDDLGTYRIFDQVKAFSPGHLVTANDVRAMLGVLAAEPNVSKAFITTTSDFAPGVYKDPRLVQFMPYRLQLRPRAALLDWLGRTSSLGHEQPTTFTRR